MQCSSSEFLKQHGLRMQSFPFDWILSHPKFVYDILHSLLEDREHAAALATQILDCPVRCAHGDIEHYVTRENGFAYYHPHHKIIFPHDDVHSPNTHATYERRLERLRQVILDKGPVHLVYTSPASASGSGAFTMDEKPVIGYNVYEVLNAILALVQKHNPKCKLTIFDAIQSDDERNLICPSIQLRRLESGNSFTYLLHQMRAEHL